MSEENTNTVCTKGCKRQCFCEQNSKINPVSRLSCTMEELRCRDLTCKEAYVTASKPKQCVTHECPPE